MFRVGTPSFLFVWLHMVVLCEQFPLQRNNFLIDCRKCKFALEFRYKNVPLRTVRWRVRFVEEEYAQQWMREGRGVEESLGRVATQLTAENSWNTTRK